MLLSAELRDAAEAGGEPSLIGPDPTVKINDEGCARTSSFYVERTRRTVERLDGFIPTSRETMQYICAQLDGLSLSQRGRLAKLDVKSQNDLLHH